MAAGRTRPPSSEEMAEATLPYYEHCIRAFGAHRCMFESVSQAMHTHTLAPHANTHSTRSLDAANHFLAAEFSGGQRLVFLPHPVELLQAHRGDASVVRQ